MTDKKKDKEEVLAKCPNLQTTKAKWILVEFFFNNIKQIYLSIQQDKETEQVKKPVKPPPIFVDKVSNIQPLISLLNKLVKGDYNIKVLRDEQIKINPRTLQAHSIIVNELQIKETEFHTYKPK